MTEKEAQEIIKSQIKCLFECDMICSECEAAIYNIEQKKQAYIMAIKALETERKE